MELPDWEMEPVIDHVGSHVADQAGDIDHAVDRAIDHAVDQSGDIDHAMDHVMERSRSLTRHRP